jgi:hypothetical protein
MRALAISELSFVSGGMEEVVVSAPKIKPGVIVVTDTMAIMNLLESLGGGNCPAGYAHTRPVDWQERTGSPGDCAPVDITAAEAARLAATALALVGEFDKRVDKIAKWLAIFAASKAVDERQDAERDGK